MILMLMSIFFQNVILLPVRSWAVRPSFEWPATLVWKGIISASAAARERTGRFRHR